MGSKAKKDALLRELAIERSYEALVHSLVLVARGNAGGGKEAT